MCCVDKLITALQHPEEIERIEAEDKRKELLRKTIKPSKEDLFNNMYMKCDKTSQIYTECLDYEPFLRQHFEVYIDGDEHLRNCVSKCTFEKQKFISDIPSDTIKSIYTLKLQFIATPYSLNWFDNLDYEKTYKISYKMFSPDGSKSFEINNSYKLEKAVLDSQRQVNETLPIMVVFKGVSEK